MDTFSERRNANISPGRKATMASFPSGNLRRSLAGAGASLPCVMIAMMIIVAHCLQLQIAYRLPTHTRKFLSLSLSSH